jgi:hypothetical protein
MRKMLYIEESKLLQVLEVLTVWSDASTTQQGKDAIKTVVAALDSVTKKQDSTAEKDLEEYVKELFEKYLDVTEESDNGYLIHPVFITSCRAYKTEGLNILIDKIRTLVLSK